MIGILMTINDFILIIDQSVMIGDDDMINR